MSYSRSELTPQDFFFTLEKKKNRVKFQVEIFETHLPRNPLYLEREGGLNEQKLS